MQDDFQKAEVEYQKALIAGRERIKSLENELKVLTEVHEEYKQHFEKLNKEFGDRGKKLMDLLVEKKTMEETYETHLKHVRTLLEEKEKEIQELQANSLSASDSEMLKSKITREIENQFKQKNENLLQELAKYDSDVFSKNIIFSSQKISDYILHLKQNMKILKDIMKSKSWT